MHTSIKIKHATMNSHYHNTDKYLKEKSLMKYYIKRIFIEINIVIIVFLRLQPIFIHMKYSVI